MSRLIYITNTSLDGYIEDETGAFDFGTPDEVHPFIVELLRPVGTYLFGRRLYETMVYWDAPVENFPPQYRDFARMWRKPEKIVFSRTLTSVPTPNTRVEHDFDREQIRKLKGESEYDLIIGGAELASLAIEANLVDECRLLVNSIILGGGKPAFTPGLQRHFELIETERVGTGVIYLRCRVRG